MPRDLGRAERCPRYPLTLVRHEEAIGLMGAKSAGAELRPRVSVLPIPGLEALSGFVVGCRFLVFLAGCRFLVFLAGCRFLVFLAGCRFLVFFGGLQAFSFFGGFLVFLAGCRFLVFLAGCRLLVFFDGLQVFGGFLVGCRVSGWVSRFDPLKVSHC